MGPRDTAVMEQEYASGGGAGLSPGALAWVTRHVETRLTAQLSNPVAPDLPPGAVDYQLDFVLPWIPAGSDAEFPDLEALLTSIVGGSQDLAGESVIDVVLGGADLAVVEVHHLSLLDALDARTQGLTDLYPPLFSRGDLDQELAETLANPGSSHAILIDELTLEIPWQDTHVASIGLGLGLTELCRGCSFAALDIAVAGEHQMAAQDLGFRPWRQGISILDLALTTLEIKVSALLIDGVRW